jgi:hypothetical protein
MLLVGQFEPFVHQDNSLGPLASGMSDVPFFPEGSFNLDMSMPSFPTVPSTLNVGPFANLTTDDVSASQRFDVALRTNMAKLQPNGPNASLQSPASLDDIASLIGLVSATNDGAAGDVAAADSNRESVRLPKRQMSGGEYAPAGGSAYQPPLDDSAASTAVRHVRRAAAPARAGEASAVPSSSGGGSGAGGFAQQFIEQLMSERGHVTDDTTDEAGQGVTQLDAYNWTIEEYSSTGLQRTLQRQDYQALLSLAGACNAACIMLGVCW